jgi:hypothetical protein
MLQPTEKKIYTPCPAKVSNNHYYNPQKWASLENTIGQIQQKWLSYMTSIDEYPLDKFKDRGIVTTGSSIAFILVCMHLSNYFAGIIRNCQ